LTLGAWCLALVACGLQLDAWRLDLGPVAVGRGPCFMDLFYFNAWGM